MQIVKQSFWRIIPINCRASDDLFTLFSVYFTSKKQAQDILFEKLSAIKDDLQMMVYDQVELPDNEYGRYFWFGKINTIEKNEDLSTNTLLSLTVDAYYLKRAVHCVQHKIIDGKTWYSEEHLPAENPVKTKFLNTDNPKIIYVHASERVLDVVC